MRKLPVGAAFGHVLQSTVNNLGFAWHLSWPWLLVILPLNLFAGIYGIGDSLSPDQASAGAVLTSLVIGLLSMFAFASIAVSWHRYILLDEVPKGWARLRADNTVWRYFGNTILIFLAIIAGLIPVAILAAIFLAVLGNFGAVFAVPLYLAAALYSMSAFYRLSVKLPAVALERQDIHMRDAWAATRDNTWQMIGLAMLFLLCAVALAIVIGLVSWLLAQSGASFLLLVSLAVQITLNWVLTIMGVTLLTSLYGFFIEQRDF
ncbi:MAG: hypothetical protein GYA66_09400 [Phyllobacteriaceae bacterium]|nr:hypothetical protein [Phyllobacteriaceae bacterium]